MHIQARSVIAQLVLAIPLVIHAVEQPGRLANCSVIDEDDDVFD